MSLRLTTAVGNITGLNNQVPLPKPGALGGPVSQSFGYDELDRLTRASGTWQGARNEQERYTLTMAYDAIHNITHKSQTHVRVPSNGKERTQAKTTYDWAYAYTGAQPHAPTQIDNRRFAYDANGNQTGWTSEKNASRRTLVWDEENRLRSVADNGRTQRYVYDASGERAFTTGAQGETAYVNQYFTVRNGTLASKHVFIGSTRLASTLVPGVKPVATASISGPAGNTQAQSALRQPAFNAKFDTHPGQGRLKRSAQGAAHAQDIYKNPNLVNGANPPPEPEEPPVPGETPAPGTPGGGQPEGNFRYFFHPDHLGSSSYVTDGDGKLYEHMQYFPFGETWVAQASNSWRTPYRFTGKELDEETGLYYFGARYYDPRTSVWQSADPIYGKYLPTAFGQDLPGKGGVFTSFNQNVYAYGFQNPIKYTDPDGNAVETAWDVFNIGLGIVSMADNIRQGSYGSAAIDAVGVIADGAATALPFVPGGAGAAIKAYRAADNVVDGVKATDNASDVIKVKEGIYEFTDKVTGKPYVGQSGDIDKRLKQHIKAGRLDPSELLSVKRTEVAGGKTAREVSEHKRIQEITGGVPARDSPDVANKVDPIGPKRQHLLSED